MTGQAAVLEVQGLTKHYGDVVGIEDLDLSVEAGEIHGFLGRNGAGKTTTMKCLMGLLRWDSGSVELFGARYVPSDFSLRSRVGFSSELPIYPSHLTGREVLEIYGRIRGLPLASAREEGRRLLEIVSLTDARDRRVGKYSRGMQAKLGLAVALLGDPALLLLDEPTAGLDPVASAEVRALFRRLTTQGTSILLSSHQLAEVQEVCRHVTVIDRGHNIIEGSITDLMNRVQGGVVIRAEFDRVPDELIAEAGRLEGVRSVHSVEGQPKATLELLLDQDRDIREPIARLAIRYGAVMLTCARIEVPLDRLFVSLVEGDSVGPPAGG